MIEERRLTIADFRSGVRIEMQTKRCGPLPRVLEALAVNNPTAHSELTLLVMP